MTFKQTFPIVFVMVAPNCWKYLQFGNSLERYWQREDFFPLTHKVPSIYSPIEVNSAKLPICVAMESPDIHRFFMFVHVAKIPQAWRCNHQIFQQSGCDICYFKINFTKHRHSLATGATAH